MIGEHILNKQEEIDCEIKKIEVYRNNMITELYKLKEMYIEKLSKGCFATIGFDDDMEMLIKVWKLHKILEKEFQFEKREVI